MNDVLRRITGSGGPGFCYDAMRHLVSYPGEHGPLLVVLDSNVVITLQDHLPDLIEQEVISYDDEWLTTQIEALGAIVDIWLMRDIRFIVLPRTFTDEKRPPQTAAAQERI